MIYKGYVVMDKEYKKAKRDELIRKYLKSRRDGGHPIMMNPDIMRVIDEDEKSQEKKV